jgi:hypothetical protein
LGEQILSVPATPGRAVWNDFDVVASSGDLVKVATLADLPDPVAGVITLEEGKAYLQTASVLDLLGDRIQLPAGPCAYLGTTSETSLLKSTGLATALFTGTHSFVMQNLSLTAAVLFDLDGTTGGVVAFDWYAVNFVDCPLIGTLKNFNNFLMLSGAFLNSSGVTFDGTMDTVAFSTTLFECDPGGTVLTIPATATVGRRFRIILSAFVVLAGESGLNVDSGSIVNNESFILDSVSFAGGGTYLSGIDETSIKALFIQNDGVTNSKTVGHYYMLNNATATLNSGVAIGVPLKLAGTTLDGPNVAKFTQTTNRATYTGSRTEFFQISVGAALSAGTGQELSLYVAKNGAVVPSSRMKATTDNGNRVNSISAFTVVELAPTNYIEIWVANDTAAVDVTCAELQVIVKRIA